MSEAGRSMGHWYKHFVTNWIKTSYSLRIPGKEFVEPRGVLVVRGKAQIFPRCDSEILHELVTTRPRFFSLSQGEAMRMIFFSLSGWAMRTSQ